MDDSTRTAPWEGGSSVRCPYEIRARYRTILSRRYIHWTQHHRLIRLLGSGGQGVVYLSEGRGTNLFTLPVALKIFSPDPYGSEEAYEEAMQQMGRVATRVAQIQQDNLVDVYHFVEINTIRVLEMEWIDGFDLGRLLGRSALRQLRDRLSPERWRLVQDRVVGRGKTQSRLRPGVAMAIVRDCLAALDALHTAGIVHADLKPSNIMLKRTGAVKLIDIGAAVLLDGAAAPLGITPAYAAPETLRSGERTPQSDLASLGYVLIEMLSGAKPFDGIDCLSGLLDAKQALADRLPEILPEEVVSAELLMNFCRKLVAADPAHRFPTASDANLNHGGAAAFHRQLTKADLGSEYDVDIHQWLENLESVETHQSRVEEA